jgi:hypothetical protein
VVPPCDFRSQRPRLRRAASSPCGRCRGLVNRQSRPHAPTPSTDPLVRWRRRALPRL